MELCENIEFKSVINVELITSMGDDNLIARAAWVSTKDDPEVDISLQDPTKVPGLINYLMKNRHGTPFENSSMTFRVHAPIFVWREHHRHRIGFSYNEESARYKQLKPIFYIPSSDRLMFKIDDWKPGRPKFLPIAITQDTIFYERLCNNIKEVCAHAYARYEENLAMGFDPGLARVVLPVDIYSACYVTCNPRSLMHFLSLRTHSPDAFFPSYPLQEIEELARKYEEIFSKLWPITYSAFQKNGRVAP